MSRIELQAGGMLYGGWEEVSITRSIEHLAGTFRLGISERWPGQQVLRAIKPGDGCTIAVDDEVVITGHVDEAVPQYDATSHNVEITGRDATGDLVDCSVVDGANQWRGRRLEHIVADLTKPFGIKVTVAADTGKAFGRELTINEGDTVFDTIDRLCRQRAVLATSDGRGGLVITRAGSGRAATRLVRGENILSARAQLSWLDRHSHYIVKGQQPGSDILPNNLVAHIRAEAKDPAVGRHRPLMIQGEQSIDQATADSRAKWEANVRAARARRATVTVQGTREKPGGALWSPNRLVPVTDDWLAIDQDMLITTTVLMKDEQGTRTALSVVPPGAFELRAEPEPKEDVWWK